jgi:tryptophan-rich sensory protein
MRLALNSLAFSFPRSGLAAFGLTPKSLMGGRSQCRIPKWKVLKIISIPPVWMLLVSLVGLSQAMLFEREPVVSQCLAPSYHWFPAGMCYYDHA